MFNYLPNKDFVKQCTCFSVMLIQSNELTTEAKLLCSCHLSLDILTIVLSYMALVQRRALRFVFNDLHASYSDLRSRAQRLVLYTERLRAILTEGFRIYLNVSPSSNRCILLKHSTPCNIRNMKCQVFRQSNMGKIPFITRLQCYGIC